MDVKIGGDTATKLLLEKRLTNKFFMLIIERLAAESYQGQL